MSLFTNAATLKTPVAASKTTAKEVTVVGLEDYAKVDALAKTLKTLQDTLGSELKDEFISDTFYNIAMETGKQPESFRGVDGIASASIECKKRSTASPLTDEEVDILTTAGLEVEEKVITEEMFGVNPKYMNDTKLLAKINKLLEGKVPDDLFVKQEKVSKKVVTDELLAAACEQKSELDRNVFQMITVLSIKPTLEVTNLSEIFKELRVLVTGESGEEIHKALTPAPKKAAAKKAKA